MSTDGLKKLRDDLKIAEVMVAGLARYLSGEALFGVTGGKLPKLTLGGYLMRQHRLRALQALLTAEEQGRLAQVVQQYNQVLEENVVRSEQRAQREYEARVRQWGEYIRDLRRDPKANFYYYATAVEPRIMLVELHTMLTTYPYQLDPALPERLQPFDVGLHNVWDRGPFVWPAEWEVAYPPERYWWLYGQPIALRQMRRG